MMDELQLEKYVIRGALECWVGVLQECVPGDNDWAESIKKDTGMPFPVFMLCVRGIVSEWQLGERLPRCGPALAEIIRKVLKDALSEIQAQTPQLEVVPGSPFPVFNRLRIQTTELTNERTETESISVAESIDRPKPKPIAAGETYKDALLELLRSGRRLTPDQRKILGMKKCSRCKEIKPFADFEPSTYADGRSAWCIECATPTTPPEDQNDFDGVDVTPRPRGNRTWPQLIMEALLDVGRAMRATEIVAFLERRYSKDKPSSSTIGVELSRLAHLDKIEQLDRGLYIAKSEEPSLLQGNERQGLIKCNQCKKRFSPREIIEHKRTLRPVTEAPLDPDERSPMGSTLGGIVADSD